MKDNDHDEGAARLDLLFEQECQQQRNGYGRTWYRGSVSGLNSLRHRRFGELPARMSLDCSPYCRRLRLIRRGCPPGASSGKKAQPPTQHRHGSKASALIPQSLASQEGPF